MNETEAKHAAHKIWAEWEHRRSKSAALGVQFYYYLQNNYRMVASFQCKGNHEAIIKSWVSEWQREDLA